MDNKGWHIVENGHVLYGRQAMPTSHSQSLALHAQALSVYFTRPPILEVSEEARYVVTRSTRVQLVDFRVTRICQRLILVLLLLVSDPREALLVESTPLGRGTGVSLQVGNGTAGRGEIACV